MDKLKFHDKKVGDLFTYEGDWLLVVEDKEKEGCDKCYFGDYEGKCWDEIACIGCERDEKNSIIYDRAGSTDLDQNFSLTTLKVSVNGYCEFCFFGQEHLSCTDAPCLDEHPDSDKSGKVIYVEEHGKDEIIKSIEDKKDMDRITKQGIKLKEEQFEKHLNNERNVNLALNIYKETGKTISLQNIVNNPYMCMDWKVILMNELGSKHGWDDEIDLKTAISYALYYKQLDWLVRNGYIEEKIRTLRTYGFGNKFVWYNSSDTKGILDKYIIARTGHISVQLINMRTGNIFDKPIKVMDVHNITMKEFEQLTNGRSDEFELVVEDW